MSSRPAFGSGTAADTALSPEATAQTPPWHGWRLDAALLVGVAVLSSFLIPARLVLPGLGAAGVPALVAGLGFMLWWAAARLVPGSFIRGSHPLRAALMVFLLLFLIAFALGFARGLPLSDVTSADRALLRMLGLVGIALVLIDGVRSRDRLDAVLKVLLVGGTFMALVGALQFVAGVDLTRDLRPPLLTLNADELVGPKQRGDGVPRVAATANHYIEFGVVMAMLVPLALHFSRHARSPGRRTAFTMTAVLLMAGTVFSVSRSAMIALLVVGIVLLLAGPWARSVNLLAASVAFLVLLGQMFPTLTTTLVGLFTGATRSPSIQSRTQDYPVVLPLVADRPWFGRGPGTYSSSQYVLLDNQWLGSLITTGLVGTLSLMLVFAVAFYQARRTGRWASKAVDRSLGHSLSASIAAAFVVSFFFDSLAFSTFAVTTFVLIGSAGALWRLTGSPAPFRSPAAGTPART